MKITDIRAFAYRIPTGTSASSVGAPEPSKDGSPSFGRTDDRPPVDDFELEVFEIAGETKPLRAHGPSILLGLEGSPRVKGGESVITVRPTEAALLPAGLEFSLDAEEPSRAALASPGRPSQTG